ncbi:hypothetical protein AX774_g6683 [Zancudomyces culisetae]|uniref:Uncharacterized protein n=1 Tax=Zancudomyces culisetae TaxID=1213189 RepID=A0A1R1PGB4_ZANCU|nr:hypothetical protein AX774_g6683 [Zancudomyces culisetae]|eukprot:OMH79892.1 hypothetical protein AX774_g6683 [Zancudomyces culisetae]
MSTTNDNNRLFNKLPANILSTIFVLAQNPRDTSTVVYKGTLFMNEGECLDIDIGNLFSGKIEFKRNLTDLKIS